MAITGSSTAATVLGTTLGGPTVGAVVGVVSGLVVDGVIDEDTLTDQIESLPVEARSKVLKAHFFWMAIEKLGMWIILAVLGFFLIPLLIGYLIPNRRQRKLEQMAFNDPKITHKDV